jgi:hypothetical protein
LSAPHRTPSTSIPGLMMRAYRIGRRRRKPLSAISNSEICKCSHQSQLCV